MRTTGSAAEVRGGKDPGFHGLRYWSAGAIDGGAAAHLTVLISYEGLSVVPGPGGRTGVAYHKKRGVLRAGYPSDQGKHPYETRRLIFTLH